MFLVWDTDRNLEGAIHLKGKSVAEVLCTLTRRAEQIERQQLGGILPQGGGRREGGGGGEGEGGGAGGRFNSLAKAKTANTSHASISDQQEKMQSMFNC